MRIRIVTFTLAGSAGTYVRHAMTIAPAFAAWPGLLAKWWLGDAASGTYGGVYLFATREDADRSRETDLFRGMFGNPQLRDITVQEYDLLDAPTAVTAPRPRSGAAFDRSDAGPRTAALPERPRNAASLASSSRRSKSGRSEKGMP